MLTVMYSDGAALRQLTRDDCLRLLATVPIGRIIYTRQAMPAVELVNFALEGGDIIVRTDRSGKLAAATRGAIVAFEADVVDTEHRTGWSVTAIGPSAEVTDAAEIARLQGIGLDSVGARPAGALHQGLTAAAERPLARYRPAGLRSRRGGVRRIVCAGREPGFRV